MEEDGGPCKFPFCVTSTLSKTDVAFYKPISLTASRDLEWLGIKAGSTVQIRMGHKKRLWVVRVIAKGNCLALSAGWRAFVDANKLRRGSELHLIWEDPCLIKACLTHRHCNFKKAKYSGRRQAAAAASPAKVAVAARPSSRPATRSTDHRPLYRNSSSAGPSTAPGAHGQQYGIPAPPPPAICAISSSNTSISLHRSKLLFYIRMQAHHFTLQLGPRNSLHQSFALEIPEASAQILTKTIESGDWTISCDCEKIWTTTLCLSKDKSMLIHDISDLILVHGIKEGDLCIFKEESFRRFKVYVYKHEHGRACCSTKK